MQHLLIQPDYNEHTGILSLIIIGSALLTITFIAVMACSFPAIVTIIIVGMLAVFPTLIFGFDLYESFDNYVSKCSVVEGVK